MADDIEAMRAAQEGVETVLEAGEPVGAAESAAAQAEGSAPPAASPPQSPAPGGSEAGRQREARARELDALLAELRHRDPVLAAGAGTDWARLAREDPAGHAAQRGAYEARLAALAALGRERETLAAMQAAEARLAAEDEALAKADPGLAAPERRAALKREVATFLGAAGFSRDEVATVGDHRALLLVRDAMRWRQQEISRATLGAKRTEEAPRRPGLAPMAPGAAGADPLGGLKRRAAGGRLDDRAAYVLAVLDGEG